MRATTVRRQSRHIWPSRGAASNSDLLPPYAPDLNLIERLRWFLKMTTLWNKHCPTFADFKAAIDGLFRNLGSCDQQL